MDVPEGAGDAAPAREKLRLNFRSWAEDYRKPEPAFDREAIGRAMRMRGLAKRKAKMNASRSRLNGAGRQDVMGARRLLEEVEASAVRQADPVEQARTFLQRRGHVVFRASVTGGPKGRWRVDGRVPSWTDDELKAFAIRRGFRPPEEANPNV